MGKENGVNYLLTKIESLEQQNLLLRKQIRQRGNFNRKLCSQNRKRRLKNNQLMNLQNDRLLQLKNIKGHQQEYKKMATNLRKALKESEQKLQQYQDEILILKTQITKQKQQSQDYEAESKTLKKQLQKKNEEFDRLMILQNQIAKKRVQTKKPLDEQEQIFRLVCQNQELQMSLKDNQRLVKNLSHQIQLAQVKIKSLQEQVQNSQEIAKLLRKQFEEQLQQAINNNNNTTITESNSKSTKQQTLKQAQNKINVSLQRYGTRLNKKQQRYFQQFDHILYTQNLLQNLSLNPITIHYCEGINIKNNHTWYTKIRLSSEGQINFGLSNNPINMTQVMTARNYIYYNNCSGLVVIDKQGKIIDEYASEGDTLTLSVSIVQDIRKIRLFKNDKPIYECGLPEQLSKSPYIYPYIKLFQFMSITLQ